MAHEIPQPVPGWKLLLAAHNKMYTIGKGILSKSKADIMASEGPKALGARRDLLSILLKANLSTSIPETQRLSDTEVIARELCPSVKCSILDNFTQRSQPFFLQATRPLVQR
jgi:hypothetical protein